MSTHHDRHIVVHLYRHSFPPLSEQLAQPAWGWVFLRWLRLLAVQIKNESNRAEASHCRKLNSHQSLSIYCALALDHCVSGWLPCRSNTHISSEHHASYEINNTAPSEVTVINIISHPFDGAILKDPILKFQCLTVLLVSSFSDSWKDKIKHLWTKILWEKS